MTSGSPKAGGPPGSTRTEGMAQKVSKLLEFLDKTVVEPQQIHRGEPEVGHTDTVLPASADRQLPGGLFFHPPVGGDSKTAVLRQKVAALELVVEEKHQSVLALKKLLDQQEESKRQLTEKLQKGFKAEIAKYEEALDRQLNMVDKLLADKNELTKKCDGLAEEMKQAEARFQLKLEEQAKRFEREAERQKRQSISAEKFQKDAQERIHLIKEQMARDHDDGLERERAHHRRLMREQHEQFEKEVRPAIARKKIHTAILRGTEPNISSEKAARFPAPDGGRFSASTVFVHLQQSAAIEQEKNRANEKLEQVAREIDALRQQHAEELERVRHELEAKEAEWRDKLAHEVERETQKKLEKVKEELLEERDRKLDAVIEKMGREQLEIQQQHRRRIDEVARSARAEASAQLKEALEKNAKLVESLKLKELEVEAAEKRIADLEFTNSERQAKIIEYEAKLEERRQQNQALLEEKEDEARKWKSVIEDQEEMFAAKLQSRDKQVLDLSKKVSESQQAAEKSRHDNELQLETIEAKVKQALWAKDETIRELREETTALETKCSTAGLDTNKAVAPLCAKTLQIGRRRNPSSSESGAVDAHITPNVYVYLAWASF
ncbi:conserved hypothetical protein [Neospora caninum Liverpool]|uniref:Uncharacterized protein n=1 Tax=Neospora caninum (strain Liverpool) TaxID=572307 RepID=F0VES3_NEOCL|nr:conserved hypothetical protein [Neospora caninum Liverpool]CBZ52217.1 conserved hypothetical protein [Neospora caninum Liverpool]|eukprot:XP_003882249.1 conserved hypothetical protein [Neospora caninum Liverpool]